MIMCLPDHVSLVGTALGAFDASRVSVRVRMRDLGLPTIGTEPGLGPGGSKLLSAVASCDVSGPGGPQKFQLGETLFVVSAMLMRHILQGDYTDMEELSEGHLKWELRQTFLRRGGWKATPIP